MDTVTGFIFLGSIIMADSDCSHEIKRHLLLGRNAMTNLDSIFKRREVTLPTKVCYSQSYGFPSSLVRMLELGHKEVWAPKNWCFHCGCSKCTEFREDSWRRPWLKKALESPLDSKEIKPVNLKGNQPWIFIGRTDTEAEIPILGHLMWRNNSLEKTLMLEKIEGRRRRGWEKMRWLDGIVESMDMEFEQISGVGEGQGSLACCSPLGCKKLDVT